jgi:hypothetical protein
LQAASEVMYDVSLELQLLLCSCQVPAAQFNFTLCLLGVC